jgi:hypothetical protein
MTPEERAEKCRRDLDEWPYQDNDPARAAIVQAHIEEAIAEALARPVLPDVAGSELTQAQLQDMQYAVGGRGRDAALRLMLSDLLCDHAFLRSVIQDEAGTSTREVRNSAFRSGAEWMREKIREALDAPVQTQPTTLRERIEFAIAPESDVSDEDDT